MAYPSVRGGPIKKALPKKHPETASLAGLPDYARIALQILLAAAALAFIALFLLVAVKRAGYPYELEWMEGGVIDHIARILNGDQLYVEPGVEFVTYTYTPLFFYAGALAAKVLGTGFLAGRLVSLAASLGCLALIFLFVRRETGSPFFGLMAAGLFAAAYSVTGFWYDLARPDMLFLLLILASAYLLRVHDTTWLLALSGLLAFLAFMSKQTTLFVAIPLASYSLGVLPGWKKAIFPGVFLGALGLSTLLLNWASDGWYYYYVFQLPRYHAIISKNFDTFPLFIYRLAVALAFSLYFVVAAFFAKDRRPAYFYSLFLGGLLFASWSVSIREGSFDNVFIPAAAGIAICFGLGAHALYKQTADDEKESPVAGRLLPLFVLLLCGAQFATLGYDPRDQWPSEADLRAGDELVRLLRDTEGDVFLPFHGFLGPKAGKRMFAQGVAIGDVIAARGPEADTLQQDINRAYNEGEFSTLVIDGEMDPGLASWLGLDAEAAASLSCEEMNYAERYDFYPVTGMRTRPETICSRK